MKQLKVYVLQQPAGLFSEEEYTGKYSFEYFEDYAGAPVSLTMPVTQKKYEWNKFPPFFDGLLPEGMMLESLLKQRKIDKNDLFSQLAATGGDLVGAVTVSPNVV